MTTTTPAGCGCPDQGPDTRPGALSRRTLLRRAGLAGGAAVAAAAVGETATTSLAFAAGPVAGDVLVVLSLRGGFDGLSAVVPAADPNYLAARPTIGVPASTLIKLTSVFGLHPAMAPLMPFWKAGTFGAVHAVGQASPTRSHFEAMAEMERAAPGSSMRTGWLDRTVGLAGTGTAFQATQVGSTSVSQALAGPAPELSVRSLDSFTISGASDATERTRWATALAALHAGGPAAVAAPAATTLGALATVAALRQGGYTPANGASYPSGSLGKALRDVARLIKADVGLQVATVDDGDWDMHAGMGDVDGGWMHDHLTSLASALAAFATDLGPLLSKVTVVTLSEFGRRVRENGSGGVDHGHGNAVLLLGGGVVGGTVHGRWPGLAPTALVDGDLAGTTDYRQVLVEILQKRVGVGSATSVFPGLSAAPLGVVRART